MWILLGGLLFVGMAVGCPSNRVYFGPLNATNAEHIQRSGVYIRQRSNFKGYPVYKHERLDEYLYYLHGNLFGGYWAIGERIGGGDALVSVQTQARRPEDAQETWHAWDSQTSSWKPIGAGRMSCVDDDFMTCSGGKIEISGLRGRQETQLHRMGTYLITNLTHSLRPVYSQEDNDEEFFFYKDGIWIIGPTIGTISGGLFTSDHAWRPEHIITPWVVFTGRHFMQVPQVTVRCKAFSSGSLPSSPFEGKIDMTNTLHETSFDSESADETELYTTKSPRFTTIPPMRSFVQPEDRTDACNPNPCQNEGHCELTKTGSFICTCPSGFFGPQCNTAIRCGRPSIPALGRLTAFLGDSFLDTVFYECTAGTLRGEQGSVCQMNGEWSVPPSCEVDSEFPAPVYPSLHHMPLTGSRPSGSNRETNIDLASALEVLNQARPGGRR